MLCKGRVSSMAPQTEGILLKTITNKGRIARQFHPWLIASTQPFDPTERACHESCPHRDSGLSAPEGRRCGGMILRSVLSDVARGNDSADVRDTLFRSEHNFVVSPRRWKKSWSHVKLCFPSRCEAVHLGRLIMVSDWQRVTPPQIRLAAVSVYE